MNVAGRCAHPQQSAVTDRGHGDIMGMDTTGRHPPRPATAPYPWHCQRPHDVTLLWSHLCHPTPL